MRIDLHTHSTVSDGTETPAEVMIAASEAGLDVVALTDHDSVLGWGEASDEASRLGLEFVPGVEVSCRHHGVSIHVVALWPRLDGEFVVMLNETRAARRDRARTMVELIARDHPITWDDVVARASAAETVGRPHIADALVDAGVTPNRDEAFVDLLGSESAYYVPHYAPEVHEAIRCVRLAGGVPVFAHPGADGRGKTVPEAVIMSMATAGLVGLEVDHRDHSAEQRERLAEIAGRAGLIRTGSSDYHGTGKLNRLGENLTTPKAFRALAAARN